MTRIYSTKLLMLILLYLLPAVMIAGEHWVGVSSQSPASSEIKVSGNLNSSAEITVAIPGFYMNEALFEGKALTLPQIPGGHPMLEQGNPDLQKLSFTLQLPANGLIQVSVTSSKFTEYSDIDIVPSSGNNTRDGLANPLFKSPSYLTDAFFPGKLIDSEQPFIVRNTRAQAFQVYPFQYNPITKVLRVYYQLTLTVVNAGGEGDNPLKSEDYRIIPIEGIGASCLNKPDNSSKSGQLPSERGSLLIICPASYKAAIAPLVEWRQQTGISTEVAGAEQFSDAEALYTFVKDYYYNHSNLAYLLLVGDAEQIPTHMLSAGASDNYYSYLAGNDHYPDILVGRFSAESAKDVEVQVSRTLQYEKNPGSDAAWIASATGIGSTLSPGDDGESDFQHVRKLLKKLKSTTYSQYNEFFDGSEGEGDANGNPSTADITAKINEGTGIIFYAGHGSPSTMATGLVKIAVVENLTNNGRFPLIWSAACENGNFAGKYCIAEAWLRAVSSNGKPAGALAALMSSSAQTSYPPMEAQDKIAELLSDPQESLSTMGAISVKGMMSMNDIYGSAGYITTDTWILFGDPSLRVRTAMPKQLIVDHNETIGAGRMSYSLKCNLNDGFACLSSQGVILGTAVVADGISTIYLDQPASGDNMTLTVTALNYLPYVATVEVIKTPGNPEFCCPLNHSKLQPVNSSFSWEAGNGGNPDYYLFYLGTNNPPNNMINGQKLTSTQLKTQLILQYDSVYYWKVVPVNSYGLAESKVMDFTTVFRPDEDFEPVFKSRMKWSDGGAQNWTIDGAQHFDGIKSIRSGQINANEYSSLIYPCEVTSCDFVSFWSKTSSDGGDKLQFLMDGISVAEWSGLTDWSFHTYKIEPGMHQLEWRYTKDNELTAGDDAAWLDNIHLPVHAPLFATVTDKGSACEGSVFEPDASAGNYFTIEWKTDGDGTFDDPNREDAVYSPGTIDLLNKSAVLQMHLHAFEGCPSLDKTIELSINPLPVITLPSDTIVGSGSYIQLDASLSGDMTYNWQPDGSSSPIAVIDSSLSVNGTKNASITVTSSAGCSATKNILIHFNNSDIADSYNIFPNPNNGNFSIAPAKGTAVIDNMMLLDNNGKMVWKNNGSFNIIGTKQVSIPGLSTGSYMLVTVNENGQSANPLVIQ